MIIISLGNLGSGKTLSEVYNMSNDTSGMVYYTNIKTNIPHCRLLTSNMIIQKVFDGKKETKTINKEFWQNIKEPISVVLDEAHQFMNARASMSKTNRILNLWVSMLRRVLGQTQFGYGNLVLITQRLESIDVYSRDMANRIHYHISYTTKTCLDCGSMWIENSESPHNANSCGNCKSFSIKILRTAVRVWKFESTTHYYMWKNTDLPIKKRPKTYFETGFVPSPENMFNVYDTLQYDNLFEDEY